MTKKEAFEEAWDNAYTGGYKDFLLKETPEIIAVDMLDCSGLVYEYFDNDFEGLVKLIEEKQSD